MEKIAVFPGSFDPFTMGHFDIVLRSIRLFDQVVVGIGKNSAKSRYFSLDMLIPKMEEAFKPYPKVKVIAYEGLTADFAKSISARFLIRGLRNTTDFEYENSIAEANKYLWNELETVFLITDPKYASVSSTIIRDIHKYGKDISAFLPYSL